MKYDKLVEAIEKDVQRKLSAPSDFKWLSGQIEKRITEHISSSTLMRIWGYMDGVTPRKVTLNILARFLGYMGYDDFEAKTADSPVPDVSEAPLEAQQRTSDILEKREEPVRKDSKRKWVWWLAILIPVLLAGTGGYFFLSKTEKPVFVTDLGQISSTKQYRIHTRNGRMGSLGVKNRLLSITWENAAERRCEEASTFAIIKCEGSYYLYSVADKRFIEVALSETDVPLVNKDCALDIHIEADSCFVIDFKNCKTVCSLNVSEKYGLMVTDFGTINGSYCDRNLFMLEEAGDFDPTEALAMMKEPNPEYTAALNAVTSGHYAIYTEADGEASKGKNTKRYYLRADGYLTETFTDSCIFSVQNVEKNAEPAPPYRLPAWRIAFEGAGSGDKASPSGFGCVAYDGDRYAPGFGRLSVGSASGDSWQDKVLFLGYNGCYAVRASNIPIETWGSGLYWAVYDLNNDGIPEVDYSNEREYVWKFERKQTKTPQTRS